MRITCEKCKAVYLIAEKIIGPKGRMVKCAKCSHCWITEPSTTTHKLIDSNICNSTHHNYLKFIIILLLICNIFSIFLFCSEYLIQYESLKNIYEKFSIYDNKNILLEDFKIKKENNSILITGKITNISNEDKAFPNIRYTVLDQNKKILIQLTMPCSKNIIQANNTLPINAKISNLKDNATYLQIDIGNKLDLFLR